MFMELNYTDKSGGHVLPLIFRGNDNKKKTLTRNIILWGALRTPGGPPKGLIGNPRFKKKT